MNIECLFRTIMIYCIANSSSVLVHVIGERITSLESINRELSESPHEAASENIVAEKHSGFKDFLCLSVNFHLVFFVILALFYNDEYVKYYAVFGTIILWFATFGACVWGLATLLVWFIHKDG